ncbi:MAG: surface antigen variable number repeat-containing protein [Bacteroidetes bacterium]|nr:surface antigen variable number repeat-containing protein [Bacteroidota bacterium]
MSFYISSISKRGLLLVFFLFHLSFAFSQDVSENAYYKITELRFKGNRKTKERIISRELAKSLHDSLLLKELPEVIKRSEQNIFNTQLFIYDTIYPVIDHSLKTIVLDIRVKERWYVWPIPVFEIQDRNFNTWWQTKDLFRINYGFALGMENFSGVKDRLVLLFQRGYSEKYGFSYRIPYINKKQTIGFNMLYVYGRNNEVTYRTEQNIPLFVRDYKNYLRKEHEGKVGITHRPNLYEQNTLEVLYKTHSVGDTVLKLNPEFFGAGRKRIDYMSLQYRYTFDNRDNKVYPLQGWAFDCWVTKDGFEYSTSAPIDLMYLTTSLRKHTKFHDRVYMSNLVRGRLMNTDNVPFHFNRALGYADLVRGYEYYVIEGQRYFMTTNSLRYQFMKPQVFEPGLLKGVRQFSTIPMYAFVNFFFDAAYVEDKFFYGTNNLTNSWQYGYGVGIDFISYYDLVMRFEYSFNKQKQSGFYIHLTSGF